MNRIVSYRINRIVTALMLWFALGAHAAEVKPSAPLPSRVQFDGLPVSQVVRVLYLEALKTPYVLDPAVMGDQRPTAFRYEAASGDLRPVLHKFLDVMGYYVETKGGVDYVRPKPTESAPSKPDEDVFVYRPRYRDGSYLVDLLGPLFKGSFTSKRTIQAAPGDKLPAQGVPPGSAAALIDRATDTLVFSGVAGEVEKLKKLLPQVDTATGEVVVRGVVYEVQTGSSEGSAFRLAASVLGGKFGVSLGSATPLDSFVRLNVGNIDAVFSALSTDSRFKVVSSPTVRVRSGGKARFVVGQDVPVLGALSYPQGAGQAVQAVEYRSSGVIFDLAPRIRDAAVDLDVTQQLSNFVSTSTGVNTSPTLIKRELSTAITASDGDLIMLGGLAEDKDTQGRSGFSFLPSFMSTRTGDKSRTEVLLFLQINKI